MIDTNIFHFLWLLQFAYINYLKNIVIILTYKLMQNLENEKLIWVAPRLILNFIDETENGTANTVDPEGIHSTDTHVENDPMS